MRIELNQDSHAVVTLSFFCDDTAAAGRMYAKLGEQIDHGRLSITTIDARPVPMAPPNPRQT
jgi:hypothetical protein